MNFQAIRGMNDILPQAIPHWQYLEQTLKALMQSYGYQEIRYPILENLGLFKRTIGEVTDIVEKEMYAFEDRNGDWLALRPEGTAGCVRAGIEHGLLYNQRQKFYYQGPMFRHERPQKGRLRQFHQWGMEVFGYEQVSAELELISLVTILFSRLGLSEQIKLQLNNIGSAESRRHYRSALIQFYEAHRESLSTEALARLQTNPLRLLDTKDPLLQTLNQEAPRLMDYWEPHSHQHWQGLCEGLEQLGIEYDINPYLVRGLDYYNDTVFEWVTQTLGAQGTVCAGGRYDGLVAQLGGKTTPAVGLALGLERLILLLEQALPVLPKPMQLHLLSTETVSITASLALATQLRDILPNSQVTVDLQGGTLKNQLKRADKQGVTWVLIPQTSAAGTEPHFELKSMREECPPLKLSLSQVGPYFLAKESK